jgi:SAM-dependent methyltransferase
MSTAKQADGSRPPSSTPENPAAATVTPGIELDFSAVAPTYRWRIPYFQKFFQKMAAVTKLNHESFVLDLACGTGELAAGIARYCGEVLGIDKSAEMLSSGRSLPANVRFLRADLNSESISISQPASLVMIGRAIPYLDRSAVMPFLDSVAGERGAVFVCAAGLSKEVAWRPAYWALCDRYRQGKAVKGFGGRLFFVNSRWKETRRIRINGLVRCRPEAIYRNALSHASLMEGILADDERFVAELNRILAPHQDAAGLITFETTSWGAEYRRQAEPG